MAFSITYNANGATGGAVPTDTNAYAAGAKVTVLGNTGGLVNGSNTFCYWNAAANDSGSVFTAGSTFTITSNTTLFAQWSTTASLPNSIGAGAGVTNNFQISYDTTLSAAAGLNPTQTLVNNADGDFNQINTWFGGIGSPFSSKITVVVGVGGWAGAGWNGPFMTTRMGNAPSADLLRYLITAEVVEMFMLKKANGWGYTGGLTDEGSTGEGLSRFLGFQMCVAKGLSPAVLNNGGGTFFVANNWLNSPRTDFVNFDPDDNQPDPTTGCTTLFIYYLFDQLKFSIPAIINAGASTMAGVYANLTGDNGNPFPFFARLVGKAFPGTNTITTGPNFDDPFPLGLLSYWCNNNTFSRDQAKDIVATQGGVVSNAFYLILEGFSIDSFNAYGVTVPTPTGGFAALSGIKVQPSPLIPGAAVPPQAIPIFEDPSNTKAPQRIRFSFDVVFTDESAFPNPGAAPVTAVLKAAAQIGGTTVKGATCAAGFELLGGANPYFTNVDATNAADLSYLSQDLRVFSVQSGHAPFFGAPSFTNDAYASIQAFIGWLNGNTAFTQPSVTDPLNALPGQIGYETADSSVTPGAPGDPNYNFAVARVRLRGTALDQANNCRVFFRLFVAQSADTDFQPSTTYKSTQGTSGADAGHPVFPLASATGLSDPGGQSLQTIPYFATDINGTHDYDGTVPNANIRNVQIPAGQDQVWAYYGCFLDIYDASGNANLGGTHHCIVAEVACSEAPIPTTTATGAAPSPLSWDQLAQRNLQITLSENPKSRATHVAPQAFDLRPSKAPIPLPGQLLDLPDELMIDWGNTPPGSVATIYWPGLQATKVLALAHSIYGSHLLSAADSHTIQCVTTKGVTYIPIPHVSGVNFAGLMTVDLPASIHHGQVFDIMVRRVSTRRGHLAPPPPPPPHLNIRTRSARDGGADEAPLGREEAKGDDFNWRQVCGAFQIRIPVTNRAVMLPQEEDTLAILKWRLQQKKAPYRWRPVWERYIELVEARVKGLGGNPEQIPPSLGGYPPGHHRPHPGHGEGHEREERREHDRDHSTGKIDGVTYDRFGDFEGFHLRTEHGHERRYRAREDEIERLVLQAWRERWVVTVVGEDRHRDHHDRHDRHHRRDDDDAPTWATRIILRRTGS